MLKSKAGVRKRERVVGKDRGNSVQNILWVNGTVSNSIQARNLPCCKKMKGSQMNS